MSGDDVMLGPGREFDAIRQILSRLGDAAAGIGDDAAVLDVPRGEQIVVSTDASIENRHFREAWLTPTEIGYRAVTAALSDLAAMAARPLAVLWSVNLPDRWRPKVDQLADGARDAALATQVTIVGGNVAASDELSLTTTVIGSVLAPLRRSGAAAGDKLYVTGRLGGPRLALNAFESGVSPDAEHRERFARPRARIREARWLADRGATAGIDISDGIAGDASHLAAASKAGFVVHLDRLPTMAGVDPTTAVLSGEEYELLVTSPDLDRDEFKRRFALDLTEIGEVSAGADVVFLQNGQRVDVGRGHDHFNT